MILKKNNKKKKKINNHIYVLDFIYFFNKY